MDDLEAKRTEKYIEAFRKLLQQAEKDSGIDQRVESEMEKDIEIEIAEVLAVGHYSLTPEVAIVRDTKGRVWAIPEDKDNNIFTGNRLVSRWNVHSGMKLRLKIKTIVKEEICGVLIVK